VAAANITPLYVIDLGFVSGNFLESRILGNLGQESPSGFGSRTFGMSHGT
jgi:hypothetical protein